MPYRTYELLVAEDNPADFYLLEQIFRELPILHRLHHVPCGRTALDFLYRRAPYEQAPQPHLLLLDLNLPAINGFEVLRTLKEDPTLRAIPVLIMTSSGRPADVTKSYNLHANAYIQKPLSLDESIEVLASVKRFWLELVQLPEAP